MNEDEIVEGSDASAGIPGGSPTEQTQNDGSVITVPHQPAPAESETVLPEQAAEPTPVPDWLLALTDFREQLIERPIEFIKRSGDDDRAVVYETQSWVVTALKEFLKHTDDTPVYDELLVDAVAAFKATHGLPGDGTSFGGATEVAALGL